MTFLSVEYWPDPQRSIKEAYRVLKIGGKAFGCLDSLQTWCSSPRRKKSIVRYRFLRYQVDKDRSKMVSWWTALWTHHGLLYNWSQAFIRGGNVLFLTSSIFDVKIQSTKSPESLKICFFVRYVNTVTFLLWTFDYILLISRII